MAGSMGGFPPCLTWGGGRGEDTGPPDPALCSAVCVSSESVVGPIRDRFLFVSVP